MGKSLIFLLHNKNKNNDKREEERERERERERITVANVKLITSIFAINIYVLARTFCPNFIWFVTHMITTTGHRHGASTPSRSNQALKEAAKPAWNLPPATLSVEFAKSTRPKFNSMFPTGKGHTIPAPQLARKESLKLDGLNVSLTFASCGMRHPAFMNACP